MHGGHREEKHEGKTHQELRVLRSNIITFSLYLYMNVQAKNELENYRTYRTKSYKILQGEKSPPPHVLMTWFSKLVLIKCQVRPARGPRLPPRGCRRPRAAQPDRRRGGARRIR